MKIRTLVQNTALALSACALATPGIAQDKRQIAPNFPSKPIKMMTTVTAGGGLDFITRTVAAKMSENLPAPVLVENVSGANGILAVNLTINSAPDGYTLLSTGGSLPINTVFKKFEKDVRTALAPVAQMSAQPYLVYVPTGSPIKSVRELIDHAKKNPGKLTYGSTGMGSVVHLGMELIAFSADAEMTHVPYKGAAPAMIDLTSGRIDAYIASYLSGLAGFKSGKIRPIAVTTPQRMSQYPDIPTVAESGVPGYELSNTYTLYVAGTTPAALVMALNRSVAQALTDPDLRKKFENDNSTPASPRSPEELRKILVSEIDRWDAVVKRANIKLEN